MDTQKTQQKVDLDLEGINGNALAILGAFSKEAKKAGWSKDEIGEVYKEATSGDYDHLLQTVTGHCK